MSSREMLDAMDEAKRLNAERKLATREAVKRALLRETPDKEIRRALGVSQQTVQAVRREMET